MNRNHSFQFAVLLLAMAVVTAGCSGSGSAMPAAPNIATLESNAAVPLGSNQLLYVNDAYAGSSYTGGVQVYAWPKPKTPIATLSGFSEPQGMCTDGNNAFIANTGDSNVLVYPGGATSPSRTIADAGEYPEGCSYDSQSGDLAVANIINTSDGPGTVAIYRKARGKPRSYGSNDVARTYDVQYDGSGNLFIVGEDPQYAPVFAELSANSKRITTICPNFFKSSQFGGSLGWDGKYIVVTGSKGSQSGVFRISGCKKIGFTPLDRVGGGFFIAGNRLIAPEAGSGSVEIYAYPKGGEPVQTLNGFLEPIDTMVVNAGKDAPVFMPGAR